MSKLNQFFAALKQRRKEPVLEFEVECAEEEEEQNLWTQLLQTQKNQFIDLQDHLERYCNILPVFGFNGAKYDISLIKSYLLPILVNERGIEPIVIKKSNQFVSFELGDVQLLETLNFLERAMSRHFLLKTYKTSKTKHYFPYEWFDDPEKLNNTQLPSYEAFFSKLHNKNPLAKDHTDFQSLLDAGLTSKGALSKLKFKEPPATGQ